MSEKNIYQNLGKGYQHMAEEMGLGEDELAVLLQQGIQQEYQRFDLQRRNQDAQALEE